MVVNGSSQDPETVYAKSSPTVATESQFMICAIAASEKRQIMSIDVVSAFLEVELDDRTHIYMHVDGELARELVTINKRYKQFMDCKGRIVVKLLRAQYGAMESALLFYQKLRMVLEELGFTVNETDQCVFNKMLNGTQCTASFHVDDIFLTHQSERVLEEVASDIEGRFTSVKRQKGPEFMHLGVLVSRKDDGSIELSQDLYVRSCCEAWGCTKGAVTPATSELLEVDEESMELSHERRDIFHSGVTKLLYVTKRTRCEIFVAVSFLAGRVNRPTEQDWSKLDRVFSYLHTNQGYGVRFNGGAELALEAWADAAFMSDDKCKSRSGGLVKMCGGVVATMSTKQKILTKSSTEAELVALDAVVHWVVICRAFMRRQGHDLTATVVHQDNRSVMAMIRAGKPSGHKSKHIDLRYFVVSGLIAEGEVTLVWCDTNEMLADALSKGLVGHAFSHTRDGLVTRVVGSVLTM